MNRSLLLRAVSLTSGVGLFIGAVFVFTQLTQNAEAKQMNLASISSSYSEYYTNLKDLKQHADIVVSGKVVKVASVNPDARTKSEGQGLITTDFAFHIDRVIHDPKQFIQHSATINVHQLGGTYGNYRLEANDDPLFKIGEEAVLFLRKSPTTPGLFFVVGGPTGRFRVENGKVYPVVQDGVQFPTTLLRDDFVERVKII